MSRIDARSYYSQYHGHPISHLEVALEAMRGDQKAAIFLAGDSSLDNKYWFSQRAAACNGYERLLSPPQMKQE